MSLRQYWTVCKSYFTCAMQSSRWAVSLSYNTVDALVITAVNICMKDINVPPNTWVTCNGYAQAAAVNMSFYCMFEDHFETSSFFLMFCLSSWCGILNLLNTMWQFGCNKDLDPDQHLWTGVEDPYTSGLHWMIFRCVVELHNLLDYNPLYIGVFFKDLQTSLHAVGLSFACWWWIISQHYLLLPTGTPMTGRRGKNKNNCWMMALYYFWENPEVMSLLSRNHWELYGFAIEFLVLPREAWFCFWVPP